MTLLVGILCKDGVVIAADQAVTFGAGNLHTIQHKARKIQIVSEKLIVAGTGQVGMGQRWVDTVTTAWRDGKTFANAKTSIDLHRGLCGHAVKDFVATNAKSGVFGALLAHADRDKFSLCEYAVADFQPELKTESMWFVAMGSGQPLADAYLALIRDAFWGNQQPSLEQGIFGAAWVMKRSIAVAVGYIAEPIDIAVIRKDGDEKKASYVARMLTDDEVQEHLDAVERSIAHFGKFQPTEKDAESAPQLPEPPVSEPPKV